LLDDEKKEARQMKCGIHVPCGCQYLRVGMEGDDQEG
jgi:hypothetical protein